MSESSESPPRVAPRSASLDDLEPPEFEPAHPRRRFDGWTPERQEAFILALAESACVADAFRAVGMPERSAYSLRARAAAIGCSTLDAPPTPCRNSPHGQCEHWDHSRRSPPGLARKEAPSVRGTGKGSPIVGIISQYAGAALFTPIATVIRNGAIPPFLQLGTARAMQPASADRPPKRSGETDMTTFSNYAQRVLAGFGALAISTLLFANALATQAAEVQSVAGILA